MVYFCVLQDQCFIWIFEYLVTPVDNRLKTNMFHHGHKKVGINNINEDIVIFSGATRCYLFSPITHNAYNTIYGLRNSV